jgi:hypothetical protein
MVICILQARRKERRRGGKRKGQFFILGAVLICMLFFVGLPLYGPQLQSYRKDLSFVSANLETEFPKALNLGIKEGSGTASLADFSRFSKMTLSGQGMKFQALWVVTEPQPLGVQVTVGNFMGQSQALSITVDGSAQNLDVPDNSTEARFFAASDNFQMTISFPGHSKEGVWVRNKANLYAFTEIARGSDKVVEETEA